MKTLCALLALLTFHVAVAGAQDAPTAAAPVEVRRTPEELEKLLAPIALYPDALIAIILPAATAPADVVLAARQLRDQPNDTSQIEHRGWDESVKSLTSYPAVLAWMDENLAWTKQVGEAFAQQPAEVMQAMQRLRAQARAAGTLVDTPQQQVITEPDVIRIVPAQPDVIYVPYYEPDVVFVSRPYVGYVHPRPFFTFGVGVRVGSWLAFECDWRRHTIWVGNRHRAWHGHDWRRPLVVAPPIGSAYVRTPEVRHWRPPPQVVRPPAPAYNTPRVTPVVVRPTPFAQVEGRPAPIARTTVIAPRHGEADRPAAGGRRSRPEVDKDQTPAPAKVVTTPALPTQPSLAPTVPPPARGTNPDPDRARDSRGRNGPPRNPPPTVVTAPPANSNPTPAPTPAPNSPPNFNRRSQPPAVIANPVPPANNPAPVARPDFRGHSRSAPAATPTPPATTPAAPAAPSQPATAPANPPPRQERQDNRRGGRPGDPER